MDGVVVLEVGDRYGDEGDYRSSAAEAERRERMAPYVESEESATYSGRELSIPGG